jgi:hypothetical protein
MPGTGTARDILEVIPEQPAADLGPNEVARISVELSVGGDAADRLYDIYAAAFVPLATRAAIDHTLPRHEFQELLDARNVYKVVGWDHCDRPVGLVTFTDDLTTDHIVSEPFYAERFPEEYSTGRLFYLGFLLVRPDAQRGAVLTQLCNVVMTYVSEDGGIIAFDVCKFNDETFKLAQICGLIAKRNRRGASIETVDVHSFYAITFPPIEQATTG